MIPTTVSFAEGLDDPNWINRETGKPMIPQRDNFVLHWGCRNRPGHFLTFPDGRMLRPAEYKELRVPTPAQLDGTDLFLPRPEKQGFGALTYLPASDLTILAWWEGKFDGRGGCNMALILSGRATAEECWQRFQAAMPSIAAQLQPPGPILPVT
jgi:hypothetical protein